MSLANWTWLKLRRRSFFKRVVYGTAERGISKAGNRHVRGIAIQLAWSWLRYQPASRLSRWYDKRFARGGPRARKVGIVAVAHKLLVELWRYLEWGVVPEGAELKT